MSAEPRQARKRGLRAAKPAAEPAVTSAVDGSFAEHFRRVQLRAYLLAEREQFAGSPEHYWLVAERQERENASPGA